VSDRHRGVGEGTVQHPRVDSFNGTLGRRESFGKVQSRYQAFDPRAAKASVCAERLVQYTREMEERTLLRRLRDGVRQFFAALDYR
jgi:hypothetical protein